MSKTNLLRIGDKEFEVTGKEKLPSGTWFSEHMQEMKITLSDGFTITAYVKNSEVERLKNHEREKSNG